VRARRAPCSDGIWNKDGAVKKILTFVQKFANDWSMNLAGMMTYSLITAIVPLIVGILSIAGLVLNLLSPSSFAHVTSSIEAALPAQARSVIDMKSVLKSLVSISGIAGIIALVGLLWTGSNLFTNVENAFSIAFRTRDRDFIPQRVMAIGMVILLALLLPLSLLASALVNAGAGLFMGFLPKPFEVVLSIVAPLTSLGILFLLFLAIYMVVPNIKVPFKDAWRGALTAAILVAIVNLIFPAYTKLFLSGNLKYGAILLSVLVLIIYLWFFNVILMIGAQVNAVAMGIAPLQYDVARTLAEDYQRKVDQARQPRKRRVPVPLPRRQAVAGAGRAISSALTALGRLLAPPLRLLALFGWLIARPFSHDEGQTRGRGRI